MSEYITKARKLRPYIVQASASLDDASASNAAELFPSLKQDGSLVPSGTRINWHGEIKRAAVDLWDTEANDPEHAPTLWDGIAYREGIRIIPDVITAGLAFAENEPGWWGDTVYISKLPANVYTPAQYPDGWEAVV